MAVTQPEPPSDEPLSAAEDRRTEEPRERTNEGSIDALTLRALFLAGAILLAITTYWALHRR